MLLKKLFSQNYKDNQQLLFLLFGLSLFVFCIFALIRIFYSFGFYMDTLEHIHASWLVSEGKVPYRDFFEHHHPLLWYLLSPVTQLFYRNINVVYVFRFIGVLAHFLSLFIMYKLVICYTASKKAAQIAILVLLSIFPLWSDVQNIRPDVFMLVSVLAAILYFLKYLDENKLKYLFLSYLLWLIAFLFLQKSIIPSLGFAIVNLLYLNKIKISNILKASILPLFCIIILFLLMYKTNTLQSWYDWNFTYNKYVTNYYSDFSVVPTYYIIMCLVFAIAIIRYYKTSVKGNVVILSWLPVSISLIIYAPYVQYFILYVFLSVLLLSPLFIKIYDKYYKLCFFILAFVVETSLVLNYMHINSKAQLDENMRLSKYLIDMTNKNDKIIKISHSFNLFNYDVSYYWFGFKNAVIIADLYMDKPFNFNEILYNSKPIFFTRNDLFDLLTFSNTSWLRKQNTALLQKASRGDKTALSKLSQINIDYWQIDMDFVKQNYRLVDTFDSTELWQRIDYSKENIAN